MSDQGQHDARRLARGGAASLAVKAVATGMSFAVSVALARWLGVEGYGVFAFALAVLTLLAIPVQAGMPELVLRETARAVADADDARMGALWRWALRGALALSAVGVAGVGIGLVLTESSARSATLLAGLALLPVIALSNLRAACLRGVRRVVLAQVPEGLVRPAVLLAALGLAAALGVAPRPEIAMALYLGGALAAAALGWAILQRVRPAPRGGDPADPGTRRAWRRAVVPLAFMAGLQLVANQADVLMLGLFRSDAEVGTYRAVFQTALLVVFGLQALAAVLQPEFARLHHRGEIARLDRLARRGAQATLALALVPLAGFVGYGAPLLGTVFGPEFAAGALALAILAAGQLAKALGGTAIFLLNMTGHEVISMRCSLAAVSVNILANLVLIPPFGMAGAAAGTALSFAVWSALMTRASARRVGVAGLPFGGGREIGKDDTE